jgi:4-hydroxythreonine-4-phosphate dehydrogenase
MKPLIVTMGDAAGIGPEVIAKAWAERRPSAAVVVGDPGVMRRAIRACGLQIPVAVLDSPDEFAPSGAMPVWSPPELPILDSVTWGHVDARAGAAAAVCIRAGVAAIQAGQGRGLVTAPIHKEALHAAGVPYPGHTEMLQALVGAPAVRMMLVNAELRVVLVTVHQSLRSACDAIRRDAVLETIRLLRSTLQDWFGLPQARIAVAGLNPHAGEGGLFGDEEQREIAPAVADAQNLGWDVSGPHAPDTVFMRAREGRFDAVVAMTHDQGLIPIKYLGLDEGVNLTLGLPWVRTSPDHGTAFDMAGTGRADPRSLMAAWELADRLS